MLRALLAVTGAVLLWGCAPSGPPAPSKPATPRPPVAPSATDPTVRGAQLFPEELAADAALGVEPGGARRALVGGVRVVRFTSGAMRTATTRFASTPSSSLALPARFGHGFVFALGTMLYRADGWLAPVRPLLTAPWPIARVIVGLDRLYVRGASGAHLGVDPRTGAALDLGPWPVSPSVGAYAAADGWRAVAVTDLRGVVTTSDAGATWHPLPLPIEAKQVVVMEDRSIAIGGLDVDRATAWFDLKTDGRLERLREAPSAPSAEPRAGDPGEGREPRSTSPFAPTPLVAAVEDGWPLTNDAALVARDGALARVRLSDGAIEELTAHAYALERSRCHAVPLPRDEAPGRFGFVCGEPQGKTVIYAWEEGTLRELARFAAPRVVLASGTGALAVRGPCDPMARGAENGAVQTSYCVLPRTGAMRALQLRGATADDRVAVLADGRIAVVTPPAGDLSAARLTLIGRGEPKVVPLRFGPLAHDLAHVAAEGIWLDGLEERSAGTLGGWIEAGGSVLGVEIGQDGAVRLGTFIRDLGAPMVAGRYGLGWTASRRGYESTDGGLTWTAFSVPEPIASGRALRRRVCGPVGCLAAGWIRVGWGEPPPSLDPPAPKPLRFDATPSHVYELACSVADGASLPLGATFYGEEAPQLRADEVALTVEATDLLDRAGRLGPLARLSAWGPKSSAWERTARWLVQWTWPFGGPAALRTTAPSPAPFASLDLARAALGVGASLPVFWTLATGDDGNHGLLIGRRTGNTGTTVLELEGRRPLREIRRADREPFGEIEGATRVGARWYLVTAQEARALPAAVLWGVDGGEARELGRVPRAGFDTRPPPVRLARRADEPALGLLVEGQPDARRSTPTRWLLPIEAQTGTPAEPVGLGSADLADAPPLTACPDASPGWVMDVPVPSPLRVVLDGRPLGSLRSTLARLHVDASGACTERLAATLEPGAPGALLAAGRARAARPRTQGEGLSLSVEVDGVRYGLRCALTP